MRAFTLLAVAVFVLAAAGLSGAATSTRVLSVYDGDTLTVASGERVRLLQIDTP
jgi:endonuclease YncB( thermonuclease family)